MRLTLLLILGFLVIAMAGFAYLLREVREDVERQYAQAAEEPMVDMAHLFASLVETEIADDGKLTTERIAQTFQKAHQRELSAHIYSLHKQQLYTHVYVTDRTGLVLYDSEDDQRTGKNYSAIRDVYLTLNGEYGARSTRHIPEDSMSSTFYVAAPVYHEEEVVGVVSVFRPERLTMGRFVEETRQSILRTGLTAIVIVALCGAGFTWLMLRPITRLTRYARGVRAGKRTELPARLGRGELRSLGRALEEMRDALEGKRYVEQYVQTLTHELKSPLAAIRGAAELLEEDMPPEKRARFLHNIRNETARTEDLVRRLLQLAEMESRRTLDRSEQVDLREMVEEEVERLQPMLLPKELQVDVEADENATLQLHGDAFALQTAIHNLLTNAVDFSPENGHIEISLESHADADALTLSIADQGPGIPDYAQKRLFDRFYSLKHSVSGKKSSGLGLCYVREVAELHGGSIRLQNRQSGGAIAHLTLARNEP